MNRGLEASGLICIKAKKPLLENCLGNGWLAVVDKNDEDNGENHDDNDHNDNSNDDDNDDDDHEGLIVGGLGGGRLAARAEQLSEVSEVRGKLDLISRRASYILFTLFYPIFVL